MLSWLFFFVLFWIAMLNMNLADAATQVRLAFFVRQARVTVIHRSATARHGLYAGGAGRRLPPVLSATVLVDLVALHGAWIVFSVVAVERAMVPLPGEVTLVAAAVLAANSATLGIENVVFAAAAGAVVGDNIGYVIGRKLGLPLLVRHGHWANIGPERLRLGQYLFARYGGAVVFFGRFVSLLRTLAAIMAGINAMPWLRFLAFNMAGAIVWASAYGFGAYYFGSRVAHLSQPMRIALLLAGLAGATALWLFLRRNEARLQEAADRAAHGQGRL